MKRNSLLTAVANYLSSEKCAGDRQARSEERARLKKHVELAKSAIATHEAALRPFDHGGASFKRIAGAVMTVFPRIGPSRLPPGSH